MFKKLWSLDTLVGKKREKKKKLYFQNYIYNNTSFKIERILFHIA